MHNQQDSGVLFFLSLLAIAAIAVVLLVLWLFNTLQMHDAMIVIAACAVCIFLFIGEHATQQRERYADIVAQYGPAAEAAQILRRHILIRYLIIAAIAGAAAYVIVFL